MPLTNEEIDALVARWKECHKRGSSFADYTVTKSKQTCSSCNAPVTKYCKTGLCTSCLSKRNRKCTRPDKETLLEELLGSSFLAVGKKYSVSDNAVRKWCHYYGLPTRARDIKRLRAEQNQADDQLNEGSSNNF